jgi:Icc-related predicted phosphoesterase
MRFVWLTDIHLNFLPPHGLQRFFGEITHQQPDAVLISGDIGEAQNVVFYLNMLAKHAQKPIYFVLGNHDFYHGSFADVAANIRTACVKSNHLIWLNDAGVVELTPDVGLVGHDSWADGRLGDYVHSELMLNDYVVIEDFAGLDKTARGLLLNRLGEAAADHFQRVLPGALSRYQHVYLLTHVPPFAEACLHNGQPSDDEGLPHFGCKAVGDALREIAAAHPDRQLTVLCGHTHSPARAQILPNLRVWAGGAEYGQPRIEHVFTLDVD